MQAVDLDAARHLDSTSTLIGPENSFNLPKIAEGSPDPSQAYFLGHSLGLMPRQSGQRLNDAISSWRERGIRGHFEGQSPWYRIDEEAIPGLKLLTGGTEREVVLMNSLSVNLHVMMQAFYRPEGDRKLVIMEGGAFPSDRYGVQTHLRVRDLSPQECIVEVSPRSGEHTLRTEDILAAIENHGEKTALVFFGAVQFVSGQVLDIEKITAAAQAKGCKVGFDLAHASGNIPLKLHDWGTDFAIGCGYKYLNGGAGDGGHAWIHERHVMNPELVHLGAWWGNDPDTRFKMQHEFEPVLRASRFALSNPPLFSAAAALGGLDVFVESARNNGGSLDALWQRREDLWQFLHATVSAIHEKMPTVFEIITPADPKEHGAMLSLFVQGKAVEIEKALCDEGFIVDARGDSVVRISVVPLWVSAEQIHHFGKRLHEILAATAL
ncbi:MAG: kynureninase [Deltaproteobacteria bacterium]|nr:kynureninase [Deltaproteobacteria bacterium]